MDPALLNLVIAALVFLTVLLVVLALQGGHARNIRPLEARLARLGQHGGPVTAEGVDEEARSNEALRKALEELEALQKSEGRSFLRHLLKSAGNGRTMSVHVILSIGVALVIFAVTYLIGMPILLAAPIALALGAWLPIVQLRRTINHRLLRFADDLPGALDLVVRGIRAGLPLIECLKLTAAEWHDPLKSEFLHIINDMGIGLNIKDAVARFAERVPRQEAKLFAIVIAIQAQSGGNLSEVLSNLSDLLRERAKLQGKIRAMTSEARTSAWIIGSIPVLLVLSVSLFSPDFIAPLFDSVMGNAILAGCLVWMGIGVLVMRSMMRVDL